MYKQKDYKEMQERSKNAKTDNDVSTTPIPKAENNDRKKKNGQQRVYETTDETCKRRISCIEERNVQTDKKYQKDATQRAKHTPSEVTNGKNVGHLKTKPSAQSNIEDNSFPRTKISIEFDKSKHEIQLEAPVIEKRIEELKQKLMVSIVEQIVFRKSHSATFLSCS